MKPAPLSDLKLILLLAAAFAALMFLFIIVRSFTSDHGAQDTLAAVAGLCFCGTTVSLLWAITRKSISFARETGWPFALNVTRRRATLHLALALGTTALLHTGFYLYALHKSELLVSSVHSTHQYSCALPSGTEAPTGLHVSMQKSPGARPLFVAFYPGRSEVVRDWYHQEVDLLAQLEIALFVRNQGLNDDLVRSLAHDAAHPPELKLANATSLAELGKALSQLPQISVSGDAYTDIENNFILQIHNAGTVQAYVTIDGENITVQFQVAGDTLWLNTKHSRWMFRPNLTVHIPKFADYHDSIDTRFHPLATLPGCLLHFFIVSAAALTPFLYIVRRRRILKPAPIAESNQ